MGRRPMRGRLDGRAWCMLLIHGAYTAANLSAATFLSILLWRVRQDLTLIAVFTGLTALTIPVAFVLNGIGFRRSGAAASIRLGLLALGAVYPTVLWLGEASASPGDLRHHQRARSGLVLRGAQRGDLAFDPLLPPVAGPVIAAGAQWGRGYVDQMVVASVVLVVAGAAPMLVWAAFARIAQPPAGERQAVPAAA